MIILDTVIVREIIPVLLVLTIISMVAAFTIFSVFVAKKSCDDDCKEVLGLLIGATSAFILSLILIGTVQNEHLEYKAYIGNGYTVNQLYEEYEVVNVEGKIFTLKKKCEE